MAVEGRTQKRDAQQWLAGLLARRLHRLGERRIGFPSGVREEVVHSAGEGGLWCTFQSAEDSPLARMWNTFDGFANGILDSEFTSETDCLLGPLLSYVMSATLLPGRLLAWAEIAFKQSGIMERLAEVQARKDDMMAIQDKVGPICTPLMSVVVLGDRLKARGDLTVAADQTTRSSASCQKADLLNFRFGPPPEPHAPANPGPSSLFCPRPMIVSAPSGSGR